MKLPANFSCWCIGFLVAGCVYILPIQGQEESAAEFGRMQPVFEAISQRDVETAEKALEELDSPLEEKEVSLMYDALQWLDGQKQWLPFLKKLCEKNPKAGMLKYYYARCHWRTGNIEECIEICKQAVNNSSKDKLLLYRVAALAYATENNKQAKEWLNRLLKLDPEHIEGKFLRACLFAREGKTENAKEILQQVVEENPKHYLAHYELGKLFNREAESEEAEKHLAITIRGYPFFLEAYNALLISLRHQEKKESLNAIQTIVNHLESWSQSKMERMRYFIRNPNSIPPRGTFELALELIEVGRRDLAKSYLEQLEEKDQSSDPCRLLLADLRYENKEYQGALNVIEQIDEPRIKALDTYAAIRAWSLYKLGKVDECKDYLESIPASLKLHSRIQELLKELKSNESSK